MASPRNKNELLVKSNNNNKKSDISPSLPKETRTAVFAARPSLGSRKASFSVWRSRRNTTCSISPIINFLVLCMFCVVAWNNMIMKESMAVAFMANGRNGFLLRSRNIVSLRSLSLSSKEQRSFVGIEASSDCSSFSRYRATTTRRMMATTTTTTTTTKAIDQKQKICLQKKQQKQEQGEQGKKDDPQQLKLLRLLDVELPEGRCMGLALMEEEEENSNNNNCDDSNNNHSSTDEEYTYLSSPQHLTREVVLANHDNKSHWIHELLHPEEIDYGLSLPSDSYFRTFLLGRITMREVLGSLDAVDGYHAILKDGHGRPKVPPGFLGSISHKNTTVVALVARTTDKANDCTTRSQNPKLGIGVDIEQTSSKRKSIARRVLTERERNDLGYLTGVTKEEEVLLRFSLKESLYKAMHPLICQYVGCQEVEITPKNDGSAAVRCNLISGAHEQFGTITAHWRRINIRGKPFFLSSGSVQIR